MPSIDSTSFSSSGRGCAIVIGIAECTGPAGKHIAWGIIGEQGAVEQGAVEQGANSPSLQGAVFEQGAVAAILQGAWVEQGAGGV